jgi:Rrf2 family protein
MAVFENGSVHISAKTDYALRAAIELATAGPGRPVTAHAIAEAQHIPLRFLLNILADLRRAELVDSRRGPTGGWWLGRPADQVTAAEVIRAVDGPLVGPSTMRPGQGSTGSVNEMWSAVRVRVRDVLEKVTIADLVSGDVARDVS